MKSAVVVTGVNRGVGLVLAEHYFDSGWRVFGACRQSSEELDREADQVNEGIDDTRPGDVARLVEALNGQEVDLLINNADCFAMSY